MVTKHEGPPAAMGLIGQLLTSVWRQVGADVALLTEYGVDGAEIRGLAGDGEPLGLRVGHTVPLDESVCVAAVTGRVPAVVADTRNERTARRLAWDRSERIGAFAAVPVYLPSGALFGGLCVAHRTPLDVLGSSTQTFLAAMAEVLGPQVEADQQARQKGHHEREAILSLFDDGRMSTVLQPIVDLATGTTLGVEALSRFATTPPRPPDLWFALAERYGLGIELEAAALSRAARLVPDLPESWYVAVNASPALLETDVLDNLLLEGICDRLVIEVTEHAAVADYDRLLSNLRRQRARGMRIAVDDAGAGFASLRHVIKLQPDLIKIDGSLIRGIDVEPMHRAMVESLALFARSSGATLVAEAVETATELAVLQDLGVPAAQGYLFAAPSALRDLRDSYPVTVPTAFLPPA